LDQVTQQIGWVEIQTWNQYQNGVQPVMTCHGAKQLDHVWISPELVPFIRQVQHWELLPDHAIIGARLELPLGSFDQCTWPMPFHIPWDLVDKDAWQVGACYAPCPTDEIDGRFVHFCGQYEQSFDGYVDAPSNTLPTTCRGRGQVVKPEVRQAAYPLLKPSRPGGGSKSRCSNLSYGIMAINHAGEPLAFREGFTSGGPPEPHSYRVAR